MGEKLDKTSDEDNFLRVKVFGKLQNDKILLIFDNFEDWVDEDGNYFVGQTSEGKKDESIRIFLNALFSLNHQIRGIFVSQKIPNRERDFIRQVKSLTQISSELEKGLEPEAALELARMEGAKVGLDKVSEAALKKKFRQNFLHSASDSIIDWLFGNGRRELCDV